MILHRIWTGKSFEAFEQLFERYGCYPLLGIVPDNLDPKLSVDPAREAFWKKMQELQEKGWTLSMHGCHHVYTTKKRRELSVECPVGVCGEKL